MMICGGPYPKSEEQPFTSDHKCPKCKGDTMQGYGLMGGGMGQYEFCENETCDYFVKHQDAKE